jgi:hypothetical protein
MSENRISIDINELNNQQRELNRLRMYDRIDDEVLAGLNELFDVIDIIAKREKKKVIVFEMVKA